MSGTPHAASIVVADDNDAVRAALRRLMEARGHVVVGEASDGAEAVELVAAAEPDVLLVDLRMPNVDGLEACRRLAKERRRTRIVMLSAYDDDSIARAARELGVHAFLSKGSGAARLCETIDEAAHASRRPD